MDPFEYNLDEESSLNVSLAASSRAATGRNPDAVAGMIKTANRMGIPTSFIRHDEGAQAKQQLLQQDFLSLQTTSPKAAAFAASDPDHAALMADDIPSFTKIEGLFGYLNTAKQSFKTAIPRIGKALNEFGYDATYLTGGQKFAELLGQKDAGKLWLDRMAQFQKQIDANTTVKPASKGQELFGMATDSITANLATLPLGVLGKAKMLMGFAVTAPGQLDEYLKAGYSPVVSAYMSLSNKSMEALTELIGVGQLYKGGKLATKAVKYAGGDLLGEEINTTYNALMDKGTLKPDMTLDDFKQQLVDTAAVTVMAGGIQGAMMHPVAKLSQEYQQNQQANLNKNFMLALGESATDSKLLKRLPEKFQELVGRLKEGGDVENVYIPGEQWRTYWQEQNADPAQMADDLVDGGSAQYVEALAAGGDIVIPLEVYATKLAATEHHAALIEHSRLHAGDATAFEAAQFEADFEQTVKELQDSAGKASADRPSYFKVYDDIYGQLQGIGYDRKTAEQYATIAAVRAKQRAAVLGKDAFELYNESPIKIVRPLPEGVQRQSVDLGIDPLLDRLRNNDVPTDESVFGESLLQFVRKRGVKDDRGDLKSMEADAGRKPGQKNILRKDGQELDRVREEAVEAGFLPEGSTTADLLDKIDQELRGTPVYSNQVANPKEHDTKLALDELKMHLDQVGLDYNQLSNEQIRRELYQIQGGELFQSDDFVQTSDGHYVFGEITEPISAKIKRQSAPILLRVGNAKEGKEHIERPERLKQLQAEGYETAEQMVEDVVAGCDAIYPGQKGNLLLAKRGHKNSVVYIQLEPSAIGDFYDVKTAAVVRGDFFDKKKPLWEKAQTNLLGDESPMRNLSGQSGILDSILSQSTANVKTLFQHKQGLAVKRGFFRSSPDMTAREIGILKDADLSTFIHESSHSWLEELKADAARTDAPEQLKNDWATVAKWLGNTDGEITREQHEQFARGGEAYFMEGKAPSAELQPIMQRFKSWLTSIYKTLAGLNVKMTEDVRGVFDRLLASEEEIKQARQAQNMVELFATAEDAGMTTAEFAAYRKQAAQAHADEVEKLDRKLMQEKAREQAQWWKDARAAMRTEVEAEAHAAPVYRAIRLLSTGKMFDGTEGPVMKLDRAVLVKMYGEPFLKRLPRGFGYIYANEGGMHPDAVASLFGYESGDAMIKEMIEAPAVNKWIDGETDMRMREQYGDMILDGTIADEAQAAIHGDRRAAVMAAELRAIKRQQKIVKPALDAQKKDDQQNRQAMNASIPSRETFQMAAAQIIGAKKIRDIPPRLYLEAERRAGKKAFDAVAKKDWQTAAEAKQQQLLNHYLYREASKAQEQIDDIMKEYDKLKKSDKKLAKSRDINLVNAARAILNRYGIDKNGLDAAEHLKQVQIYTPDLYQDLSAAIEAASQSPKPYKQLTMDEFLAVNDAVMNLWELSKRSKQIEIDGKIVNRDEVIDELNARMEELGLPANQAGKKQAVTKWEKFSAALVGVRAATTRVEAWVDAMDGGKADGVFRRYIWNPVIDGVDKYRTAKQDYISRYLDLLKPIEAGISQEKIASPELGYTFNGKQELLGALLHTGNESNMEKLLVGRQWGLIAEDGGLDTTEWDGFVNRMMDEGKLTKADFDFIQGVWDLLEEAKPLAQKAHKEMYGYYFSEITANEFTNSFGTYRGGYAPAISDSFMNQDQAARQEKESLESTNNSFMFPSTGRGFTKSRVTYNKPLIIDLRLVPSSLDKVLRFAFIEPRVKDVGRVVVNPLFREVLNQFNAAAGGSMLVPWLQRTAQQTVSTPSTGTDGRARDWIFQVLRRNTGLQMMVANVSNTIQQFTGLALAATKVKPTYLKSALWRYVQHPMVTAEEVSAQSEFMASNHNLSAYDMQQQAEDILLNPNVYEKVKDFSVKNGYLLQQITQRTVNVVTWAGAYDQAIVEGANEKDAVRSADSAVRMTQGTFNAEDVSKLETGSPFVRAFTQFYTYFNMQANLLGSVAVGSIREKGLSGAAPTMLRLYAAFAIAAIASEAIVMAAKGGPDPDDDELDIALKLLIMPQIKTALAMVPFVGSAINYGMNLLNDKKYDDRISTAPFLSQVEATIRAPISVYKYAADDGSMKMAVKDTLAAIGMVTGLPAGALGRPLGYLAGIADGKYEPSGPLDLTRGLITGMKSQ